MLVQGWIYTHPLSLVGLIPLYLAFLMWIISRMGAWALLARRFRASEPFYGQTWNWQSARFRWHCSYNNCLTVGSSQDALYFSVSLPFRIFHPPLLIPWREIEVETGKSMFGWYDTALLRVGTEERIRVRIYGKLVNRVRQAAGPGWPLFQIEEMGRQSKV